MTGCSGRVSRGTRTRRWLHRRWPTLETTGRGRAGEGSERRRRAPWTEHSVNRSATRQPRTQRGGGVTATGFPPPPPPDAPLSNREPRSGFSAPSPTLSPPNPGGHGGSSHPPPPRHRRPGASRGRDEHGVAAATRSGTSTGWGKLACARGGGGGGHRCRLKEGGGWEMDTCDRTYVWSSLSAVLSLFFFTMVFTL